MTDLSKWRLFVKEGRQVWRYIPNPTTVQSFVEKYLLGLDVSNDLPEMEPPKNSRQAARTAIKFYSKLQTEDGHWANDYGGPLFLLPGLVITLYCTGVELSDEHKKEIIRYLTLHQRADGGWGLHIESPSTIFGSVMNYVALRIVGMEKNHEVTTKARNFFKANGGAKGIPSWGKFFLAVLGVYSYEGMNPLIPEMWLLPYWLPIHPGRFWCHCRMVYLPMCYIYGKKAVSKDNPLIRSLREELYVEPYESIDWTAQKWNCSQLDAYVRPSWFVKLVFGLLSIYERYHWPWLRKRALQEVIENVHFEDESTKYVCIGPVNKAINMLCVWHEKGGDSLQFKAHLDRVYDYLWLAHDGLKMQGYNGSQLWDTAFSLQAIIESGLGHEFAETMKLGHSYLDVTQVRENVPNNERYYRHISKGAWPFSTRDHGWPISDCTAEGLKTVLLLRQFEFITPLEDVRYYDAIDVILSLQNTDGGWATYENKRGPNWLELLNPSEVFYDIIVDYSYVECSSACVQALCMFRKHFPDHRPSEVNEAIRRGVAFIKKIQRPDGSWIGNWGVCFTYGTWFGVEGLVAAGESEMSPHLKKACQFLEDKQRDDGGWGETFLSCVNRAWSENETSQTVNTAWAVLTLLKAGGKKQIIDRGIKNLLSKQLPNGDWAQESISGVFNANCAISYSAYKNVFPIWALSRYSNFYGIF